LIPRILRSLITAWCELIPGGLRKFTKPLSIA